MQTLKFGKLNKTEFNILNELRTSADKSCISIFITGRQTLKIKAAKKLIKDYPGLFVLHKYHHIKAVGKRSGFWIYRFEIVLPKFEVFS